MSMERHHIRTSKRHAALAALAEIRDWLRETQLALTGMNNIPKPMVESFNTVAKQLGAEGMWCSAEAPTVEKGGSHETVDSREVE